MKRRSAIVAIYHLSVKPVKRGEGRSAPAAAAYRAGERLPDLERGVVHDYTRKRGVLHSEIVLPRSAAQADVNWARDRAQLWNAAEAAERRKDARIAREYEVALPHELKPTQRVALVQDFARTLAERYQVAVDFSLHAPDAKGDQRNHHAHILTTTREITPTGLGAKSAIELSDTDRQRRGLTKGAQEIEWIRAHWGQLTNSALERARSAERIDHRSLEAQGIDREPTTHLGPAVTQLERRGERTEVLWRIEHEVTDRLSAAAEAGRLEREQQTLAASILDTEADLKAALAERSQEFETDLRAQAHRALAEWRARQAQHNAHARSASASHTPQPPTLEIDP